MKKYLGILIVVFLVSGCVTYENGEPVKDEAYEKRQSEKQTEEKEKEVDGSKEDEVKKQDQKRKENRLIDEALLEDNKNITEATLYDEGMLIIKLNADGSFSENSLVTNQAFDLLEIMKDAFSNSNVKTVDAIIRVTMIDSKGNESLSDAVNIVYTREGFEELNYDNFVDLALGEEWRIYNESSEFHNS